MSGFQLVFASRCSDRSISLITSFVGVWAACCAMPASPAVAQVASDAFAGAKPGDERAAAGVKLCWCPPGEFRMGSPVTEPERRPDEDQVDVTLSIGFWMAKYETTQAEWKR